MANGVPLMLGVVRAVTDPDNDCAEFAIIVRPEQKGQGLGRPLMDKLLRYLVRQVTMQLECDVLSQNLPTLRLAKHLGMKPVAPLSDVQALHFKMRLNQPVDTDVTWPAPPQRPASLAVGKALASLRIINDKRPGVDEYCLAGC